MKETLISFDTAKLAKKKGFDIVTRKAFDYRIYQPSGNFLENLEEIHNTKNYSNSEYERYYRPSQTILQKWLREEHKIYVDAYFNANIINSTKVIVTAIVNQEEWWSEGEKIKSWKVVFENRFSLRDEKYEFNISNYDDESYKVETFTYEEALEIGLQKGLELINF